VLKIASNQPTNASIDEIQANLRERAREIVKRRPELKDS
jgi:hypothetical protein